MLTLFYECTYDVTSLRVFPANIERSSLKTSMHLYCDVTSLCKFGALKSYLFLVLSRVPLRSKAYCLDSMMYEVCHFMQLENCISV